MYNMMLTGFPVCPENAKPDIVFLTGRAVETFDDSELEALLKKNLIINHDALAPLAKRGINLGVRALPKAGGTEFVDGRTYWFFGGVPLEVESADAEILAGFQSGGKMRAGLVRCENAAGGVRACRGRLRVCEKSDAFQAQGNARRHRQNRAAFGAARHHMARRGLSSRRQKGQGVRGDDYEPFGGQVASFETADSQSQIADAEMGNPARRVRTRMRVQRRFTRA